MSENSADGHLINLVYTISRNSLTDSESDELYMKDDALSSASLLLRSIIDKKIFLSNFIFHWLNFYIPGENAEESTQNSTHVEEPLRR